MQKESNEFLKKLLSESGPSGFEEQAQKVFVDRTKKFADSVNIDVMGNAVAILNEKAKLKVMLAGHCDEIGFIITHITDNGFLYVESIGGIDKKVVPGSHVVIQAERGNIVGVIGKTAIHLEESTQRNKVLPLDKLFIDIGAKNKKDAVKKVDVGDPVSFVPNFVELGSHIFSSKGCDNKVGSFVVSEVIRVLSKQKNKLKVGVYGVSTVQEEVGLRGARVGAFNVNPDVGIAIDVTFASDTPDSSKSELGIVELGKGGVIHPGPANNRKLYDLVKKTAKTKQIPFQIQASGYPGGTDTDAIQLTRSGVATVLISVPNRYMHTQVETCSTKDLDAIVKLIAETILSLKEGSTFIPKV